MTSFGGGTTAFSSWKIKTIKPSIGSGNIEFNYASIPVNTVVPLTKYGSINFDDPVVAAQTSSDQANLQIAPDISCEDPYTDQIVYNEKTIQTINFPNGSIDFELEDSNRSIKNISIYNDSKLIKRIVFYRSKFNNNYTDHIRLDSIKVFDGNLENPETYKFEYNSNLITNRNAVDYWGYYNGRNDGCTDREYTYINGVNLNLKIPYTVTPFSGDRSVNSGKAKAQTLEKIIYPTGGSSQFVYESNRYSASSTLGGGLRIKSIINNDGHQSITKTYNYGQGFIPFPINNRFYYTTTTYNLVPIWDSYNNNTLRKFIAYRSRNFSNSINSALGDNGVKYNMVEESLGSSGSPIGKNVYYYSYDNESSYKTYLSGIPNDEGRIVPSNLNDWGNGLMVKKEVYKNSGGNLVKIQSNEFDYQIIKDAEVKRNLKVFNLVDITNSNNALISQKWNWIQLAKSFGNGGGLNNNYNLHGFYNYGLRTGRVKLLNTRKVEYYQNLNTVDSLVVSSDYEYNENNYISEEIQLTSSGDSKKVNYKYPADFPSETVYNNMVAENMLNFPIEIIFSENDDFSSKQRENYKNWGNGIYAPEVIQFEKADGAQIDRLEYHSYDDYGNPLEVSKAGGAHIFYLWGYHGQYPIAKIENTTKTALVGVLGALEDVNESDLSAINNLRNNSTFKNTMITTYDYDPLIGISVMKDARGRSTSYEYDAFGRLKLIKDHDGKLLEEYKYHYKGE
ncbi:RHS repeat domain-containing protein [Zunongwangia pacifica]|uniref:RHS repeat protein n=1 Tax=Zunongwangia pacifica TaxID=2911062 RepID=A0A9X2A080_9FLAO|nr:RHS repeat protein [Zunongwangia pacifica]